MGKVILEMPGTINMKLKVQSISEAIKKLIQLRNTNRNLKNTLKGIRKFKGIAKYKESEGWKNEWYHQ